MENNPAEQPTQLQQPVQPVTPASQPFQTPPPSEPQGGLPLGKIALVIVGVLILLAVLTGGYLLVKGNSQKPTPTPIAVATPTPSPVDKTANWKTFSGSGFTVKYPPGYSAKEIEFVRSPEYSSGHMYNFTKDTNLITLSVVDNVLGLTLKGALGNGPNVRYTSDLLSGKTTSQLSVDNQEAIGVKDLLVGQFGNVNDIVWIKDNTVYQANTYTDAEYNILVQMLSTFKFTNSTSSSDETANWQLFTGNGFEIKYPGDLFTTKTQGQFNTIDPVSSFNNKSPFAVTYSISIIPFQNTNNMSLNDPYSLFGHGVMLEYSKDLIAGKTIQNITIGGEKALRIDDIPAGQAGLGSEIYTIKDNSVYEIVTTPVQVTGNENANKALYEKILSTFKFTQ